jgi:hypothetical protein
MIESQASANKIACNQRGFVLLSQKFLCFAPTDYKTGKYFGVRVLDRITTSGKCVQPGFRDGEAPIKYQKLKVAFYCNYYVNKNNGTKLRCNFSLNSFKLEISTQIPELSTTMTS